MSEINTETIEDIKTELVLKILQSILGFSDIKKLPKNDELRSFICQFEPKYAYYYARDIDKAPTEETRTVACKDPYWAYTYAHDIDRAPSEETRTAACKDPNWAYNYALLVDEAPTEETRTAACKDPFWAKEYQEWEQKYNEKY